MTPRVHQEWHNRVKAEYTSAIITSRLLQLLILIGVSDELINLCMRIVRDELDHARLSYDCFVAFGGDTDNVTLHAATLPKPPHPDEILPQLLDDLTYSFLLGESFAVPLFLKMYENASHPMAQEMLTRVLQDEATHRAFGWMVLDALLDNPQFQIRDYITKKLPSFLSDFKRAYVTYALNEPLSEIEKSCGLMDLKDYSNIWSNTYTNDISIRFKKRQIDCPQIDAI